MTPNKEDYLKLIFELGGFEKKISNKAIVAGLNVSAASVSEMIAKLEKENFVKHTPYQGVQLTESGLQKASTLVRKHRLWEVFLVEKLGYSWHEVHVEAEVLEHVTSRELARRLEAFLDYPESCPHGGIIPPDQQPILEDKLKSLADYTVDSSVKIERVIDESELLDYLASLNIQIKNEYLITKISDYDGPIFLQDHAGKEYPVSQKAASNIFVSPLSSL